MNSHPSESIGYYLSLRAILVSLFCIFVCTILSLGAYVKGEYGLSIFFFIMVVVGLAIFFWAYKRARDHELYVEYRRSRQLVSVYYKLLGCVVLRFSLFVLRVLLWFVVSAFLSGLKIRFIYFCQCRRRFYFRVCFIIAILFWFTLVTIFLVMLIVVRFLNVHAIHHLLAF